MKLGESIRVTAPIERAAVDDNTAHSGAVASDPLSGRMDNNIYAMVDGTTKITGTAKGIVTLYFQGAAIPVMLALAPLEND